MTSSFSRRRVVSRHVQVGADARGSRPLAFRFRGDHAPKTIIFRSDPNRRFR